MNFAKVRIRTGVFERERERLVGIEHRRREFFLCTHDNMWNVVPIRPTHRFSWLYGQGLGNEREVVDFYFRTIGRVFKAHASRTNCSAAYGSAGPGHVLQEATTINSIFVRVMFDSTDQIVLLQRERCRTPVKCSTQIDARLFPFHRRFD